MNFKRSIHAIDSHTMGEPTRIIVGGFPNISGKTMIEKKQYLQENLDFIRTAVMLEPRGHNNMFGSIMTNACSDEADFGIIFMDNGGYLNMCGHGSIGAVNAAVETGMVEMKTPKTVVKFDTPAGLIRAEALIENNKVKEVSIMNVASFLYKKDVKINIEKYGEITLDIAFGGSFFAIVNAKQFDLEIKPKNAYQIKKLGVLLRKQINKSIEVMHPTLKHINRVDLVEFYQETSSDADFKNVVVFGKGQIDRSPCGTGTSAKMATLYAEGKLKIGETFTYESIIGTTFKGKIVAATKVGEYDAIIPQITGASYITGFNQFVIDEDDPVKYGFTIE